MGDGKSAKRRAARRCIYGKSAERRATELTHMKKKRNRPILKRVVLIFIIGLSAALQYNAARYFAIAGVLPNLMLVAAVTAGFTLGSETGGFAGLCLGLYQDAQNGKILGMYALLYLYAGVLAGFFPKKSSIADLPTSLIAVYLMSALYEGAVFLFAYTIPILRGGLSPGAGLLHAAVGIIIPAAFINAIWGLPYFFILRARAEKQQ